MTNVINVRKAFSYVLESSSINYVRNYNFNSATVTDIRLTLNNSDTSIPITVDMSASVPWIRVKNSAGRDITFPSGNVVLSPSSSQTVLLQVDLPPEIESIETSTLYPDIRFRVVSGSNPILTNTNTGTSTDTTIKNTIQLTSNTVNIFVNEQSDVITAYVYDENGNLEQYPGIIWTSDNTSVVQIDEYAQTTENQAPPNIDLPETGIRYLRGVSVGTARVTVTSGTRSSVIQVNVQLRRHSTGPDETTSTSV